jgi:hypothetical protein
MRLNKDEFRIAFGINGERCDANGCSGMIRYQVDWKTADGTTRSETKHVYYTVSPHATRTIAVDRQYFDSLPQRVQIFHERRDCPIQPLHLGIAGLDQVVLIRSVRARSMTQSEMPGRQFQGRIGEYIARP